MYHLFVVRTARRDELARHLGERGIATGVHYPVPCHRQPAVVELARVARAAAHRGLVGEILTLPLSAGHTEAEVDEVIAAVRGFHSR